MLRFSLFFYALLEFAFLDAFCQIVLKIVLRFETAVTDCAPDKT